MPASVVTLVDGMQFVADFGSGHAIVMDGPEEFGGHDSGPRPMELLLAGLGGCTGMDVASILRKKRQPFTGLKVDVRGTKAEGHPGRYTRIVVDYEVRGRGVSEEAVRKAIELSMKKYCSVAATLRGSAEIEYTFSVVDETSSPTG